MSFEFSIVLKTTVIFACAGVLSLMLRRASASARHAVWAIGFWAALALPLIPAMLPVIELPVLPQQDERQEAVQVERAVPKPGLTDNPVPFVRESGTRFNGSIAAGTEQAAVPAPPPLVSQWTMNEWLALLWGLGALVVVLRAFLGVRDVCRLRRNSKVAVDESWGRDLAQLQQDLAITKTVELRIGGEAVPPMTWGVFRHVILLPIAALEWTSERCRLVLAHELAHVKRNDGLMQICVQAVCSLYWFNPMAWYASYRLRIERERACDDRVLNLGADADDYADHLLQIARDVNSGFSFATVSMAHPSQLESRLLAILNPHTQRQALTKVATAALLLSIALLTGSVAAIQVTALARMTLPVFTTALLVPNLTEPATVSAVAVLQPEQQAAAPSQAAPGTVQGTVVQTETSEPIANAQITLNVLTGHQDLDSLKNAMAAMGMPPGALEGMLADAQKLSPERLQREIEDLRKEGMPAEFLAFFTQMQSAKVGKPGFPVRAQSDASGRFTIPDVPPGDYTLTVAREGFLGANSKDPLSPPTVASMEVHVGAQQPIANLTISMIRGALITGRVRDASGNPQVSVEVQAGSVLYQNGRRVLQRVASAMTNDRGEYRLFWLSPGDYILSTLPPAKVASSATLAPVQTFYPSTAEFSAAMPVGVKPGDEMRGIDMILRTAPALKISGRVISSLPPPQASLRGARPSGGPAESEIMVYLRPRPALMVDEGGTPFNRIVHSANRTNGEFKIEVPGVPPGAYELFARLPASLNGSSTPKTAWGRTAIEIGSGDLQNVTIVVNPGVEVTGQVTVDGIIPADGSALQILMQPEANALALYGKDTGTVLNRVRPDGSFTTAALSDGNYKVRIFGLAPDAYVSDVRQSNVNVYASGINVSGKIADAVDVSVRTDGRTVEGTVREKGNMLSASTTVILIPSSDQRQNAERYKTATSDSQGRFTIRGIVPGTYTAFAWDSMPPGAYQSPEFLSKYETQGTAVDVRSVSINGVQVLVIPKG